jgi:hypothetical protein
MRRATLTALGEAPCWWRWFGSPRGLGRWAGSQIGTPRRGVVDRRTATLLYAGWDRRPAMRRKVPLTRRAPAPRQPSHRTGGDRSCSGGAPARRAAASHPAAEHGDRWAGHAGRSQRSGRHLGPHKPGGLAGDRGSDHVLGVLAGGQAPEASAQPQLRGPGAAQARPRRGRGLGGPGPGGVRGAQARRRGGPSRPRPTQASWARRWALPVLVICPRRVDVPLEYSLGTRPQKPVNAAA